MRCRNCGKMRHLSFLIISLSLSVSLLLSLSCLVEEAMHSGMSKSWVCPRSAVRHLFGTGDRFHGRRFFHGLGGRDGFGMIQAHYIYCALYSYYYYIVLYNEIIIQLTIMLTGGRAQAVMRAMGSSCKYRWSFARAPTTHLLLCGPVPNRPRTGTSPWSKGWGPPALDYWPVHGKEASQDRYWDSS